MTLPNDIARCNNEECQLRTTCLRYLDKEQGCWFTDFRPDASGGCDSFIQNTQPLDHE